VGMLEPGRQALAAEQLPANEVVTRVQLVTATLAVVVHTVADVVAVEGEVSAEDVAAVVAVAGLTSRQEARKTRQSLWRRANLEERLARRLAVDELIEGVKLREG